jgi:hypothetical protein
MHTQIQRSKHYIKKNTNTLSCYESHMPFLGHFICHKILGKKLKKKKKKKRYGKKKLTNFEQRTKKLS